MVSWARSALPSSSKALKECTTIHPRLLHGTIPTSFLSKICRPKAGANLCVSVCSSPPPGEVCKALPRMPPPGPPGLFKAAVGQGYRPCSCLWTGHCPSALLPYPAVRDSEASVCFQQVESAVGRSLQPLTQDHLQRNKLLKADTYWSRYRRSHLKETKYQLGS